mgnify:CR=1 FL=1
MLEVAVHIGPKTMMLEKFVIARVNAMSTSVRHFLTVHHSGCGPISASFSGKNS